MFKKLVLAMLALTLVASCALSGEKFKVFLITMDQTDQHWNNVDAGAKKAAAELGNIDYTWSAPDMKDDAKQIEIINNSSAAGADLILLAANGPTAVTSALREAVSQGVKIIYVDSPADFAAIATFSTNNKAAGYTAGEEMIKALKAAGKNSGKIGIVNVNASTASAVLREEGFRDALAGSPYELLQTQYAEGDAAKSKDVATNYIIQGCVGVYGTNEGSTTGVGTAIYEDGNSIIGVGFDNSDSIRALIKGGSLVCAMVQDPFAMGYKGMNGAGQALTTGYTGPEVVDTGVIVMTKDKL